MRDQPIHGFTLSQHGAAFGGRNQGRNLFKLRFFRARQPVRAKPQRLDERAVHDQISITADW